MSEQTPYEKYKSKEADRERRIKENAPMKWWWFGQRDPIARFTLYVGIFTLGLLITGLLQWSAIRGQLHEMRAQRLMTVAQLRAYLFVDAQEIRKFGTAEAPEGWLLIKNSGETPAFDLERAANLMYTRFPAKEMPSLDWLGAKAYLAPKGEVFFGPIPLPRPLTAQENAAVVAGTHAIYLFGKLRYRDTFGQERHVEFRSFFRGNGTAINGATLATQQDADGNNSD